jgi:hypothetical protein
MATDAQNSSDSRVHEVVLTRVGDDAVIRPLDGVTMEEVKHYVASERNRNRRVVVWTGTLLLCVFLFFLVIFLSIGIYVVRGQRSTRQTLDGVQSIAAVNGDGLMNVSNRVGLLEGVQLEINRLLVQLENSEVTRARELDAILMDLEKLRVDLESRDAETANRLAAYQERVRDTEEQAEEKIASIRSELESLIGGFAAVQPVQAAVGPTADDMIGLPDFGSLPDADGSPDQALDTIELTDAALQAAGIFEFQETRPEESPDERQEIYVITFPNGDRYEGEMIDGLMHGWGIYSTHNGGRYDGKFLDGMREGRGTVVYANGDKYVGVFHADMKAGRGAIHYTNGDRYLGEFGNDMRFGKGTLLYANGNKYAGDFRNDVRHGGGILRFSNGDIYRGQFAEDLRTGRGTYVFTDGSRYIGDFVNGRRHGQGQYVYASGDEFVGRFRHGMREGEGTSILANGKRIKGFWEGDKMVRNLP